MKTCALQLTCSIRVICSLSLTTPVVITMWKCFQSTLRFTVLPLGLSVGPFFFYETQKALTKQWRSHGIRIFTYLDDGAGAVSDFYEAQRVSNLVRQDVQSSSL